MPSPAKCFPLLAALCGLFFAQIVLADSVSGTFELEGKSLSPTAVTAFRVRDQGNPREFATYVMLSTKPLNLDALAKDADPYAVAINDAAVMEADHMGIRIAADGTAVMNANVGGTQYIDSSGKIMGQTGSLVSACTTNTLERVTCSVKSAKPVKTMDGTRWTVDVKFDSAVLARAAGTPLPKEGGEAGKTLSALIKASKGNDLAAILALLAPRQAEQYAHDYNTPAENLASAKEFLGFTLPKQHKITGGELRDENTALLEVEGVPDADTRVLYIVTLVRTDGKWGFVFSQWVGKLD